MNQRSWRASRLFVQNGWRTNINEFVSVVFVQTISKLYFMAIFARRGHESVSFERNYACSVQDVFECLSDHFAHEAGKFRARLFCSICPQLSTWPAPRQTLENHKWNGMNDKKLPSQKFSGWVPQTHEDFRNDYVSVDFGMMFRVQPLVFGESEVLFNENWSTLSLPSIFTWMFWQFKGIEEITHFYQWPG